MTRRFTILGCGSSMGVPRVALGWGACDPANPKNRRRRCSLLVEQTGPGGVTRVLIDCSPDLRAQLLDAGVEHIDAVLLTHEHADHTHGIDDLRPLYLRQRKPIPMYMDRTTGDIIRRRFAYCFETAPGSDYPPIVAGHELTVGESVTIDGPGGPITALPYLQFHGAIQSLGFRFDDVAYSADLKGLPPDSLAVLGGLDVWIVDALRYAEHSSHLNVAEALDLIRAVKPARAILSNLHSDLDYEDLGAKLPAGVEPAFDGLSFAATKFKK